MQSGSEEMKKMVKCTSCGAEFDAEMVRCPYCGTAYEPAAEEEYMGQLENVRTELEGHREDAAKTTGKALFRSIVIFAVVVIIILALGISIFVLPQMRYQKRQQEKKQEFLQKNSVNSQGTEVEEETK